MTPDSNILVEELVKNELKATIRDSSYANKPKKTTRVFSNCIEVPILLPKGTIVNLKMLKNIVCEDLCKTINIMVINNMFRRVVKCHYGVVPIQNYFSLRESEDREFVYFVSDSP